ncbi:MAG: hypothetical protein ACRYFX_16455 [Janthinobacterium lividum]
MEPYSESSSPLSHSAPSATPPPTLLRNLGFWLLAQALGTVLLFFLAVFVTKGSSGMPELVAVAVSIAAIVSLPALPLLLPLLPWALGSPATVRLRWLRVATLQSASLGLILGLVYGLDIFHGYDRERILPVATVYFVGGLLAAPLVYGRWLWPQPHPARAVGGQAE